MSKEGFIFVADFHNRAIKIFDSIGQFVHKIETKRDPLSIALNRNGNLVVTENRNFIEIIDVNISSQISQFGTVGSGNGQFDAPFGIAIKEETGEIIVGDSNNHRIQFFDPDGKFLRKYGTEGTGEGQFSHPYRVCVDSNGNFAVSDCHNHRIQVLDLYGNVIQMYGSGSQKTLNFPWGVTFSGDQLIVADFSNHCVKILK